MCADSSLVDFHLLPIAEMEEILDRFEVRIDTAMQAAPPTKQWVKEALHRKGSGRCPVRMKRLSFELIIRYGDALADLFCEFPDDLNAIVPYDYAIGYQPPDRSPRINTLEVMLRGAEWKDEWGTTWGHAEGGVGATPVDFPLKDWGQLDDFLASIPDPRAPGRLDEAMRVLKKHGATKYSFGYIQLMMFERLHALRSMEQLFLDFYLHESELRRLMDAIEGYLLELIRYWAEIGADGIFFTDDWGSQTSLMISPKMWRERFKPYYSRIFEEVHRLGMDVLLHSCGNITQIVGDLTDVGVDILDPIQPGAMDIDAIVRQFGGRVSFSGGIDVQHLLCHGSPKQIKDTVRRLIDTVGRPLGGGLIIAPANEVMPETPLENLRALFESSHAQ